MSNTDYNQSDYSSSTHLADFDEESVASDAERPSVPKVGSWSAQWIWLSRSVYPDRQTSRPTVFCKDEYPHAVALLRKAFSLPFKPCKATAWISGDTKYRCRANDGLVACGPAEVGGDYGNSESPDWWFYEGIQLEDCLRQGRNVIAADVMLGPQVMADYSMGRGAFLLELVIEGEGGEHFTLCTDHTWRATLSGAETQPDVYDARHEPRGWTVANFDDSEWPYADIVGTVEKSPWKLLPREIPMLAETRVPPIAVVFAGKPAPVGLFPLSLEPGGPQTFRLQFPREVAGHVFLDLEGAEGAHVELNFQELPDVRGRKETYILPGHRWSHRSRRLQGFEYVEVSITFPGDAQCSTPLTIRTIDAISTSFPVAYRGSFECSDPFLNQLWAVGRWTTQICMQAYHLDSPIHQEGLGCTADYMIEALISYCCFGEARLARKDILRTAYLLRLKQGRMFMPSYSLLWVWMLRDYWMYTNDEDTVNDVLTTMHDLLDLFDSYVGPTGLVTGVPNYIFMDWVMVGDYTMHHPPGSMGHGYMTAFYYQSLEYGAEISRLFGDRDRAKLYDRRAAAVKAEFNKQLWRPDRGIYCDGIPGATESAPGEWLPADSLEESFSIHTNALAVAVGIAPTHSLQAIMRRVLADESLPMVQPYFMHYVFNALEKADLFEEYAFGIMDRWKPLLEEHPTSLKETWDGGDYSHAWGGTPTYQLSTRVLGISVREPGFRALLLRPCLGPLRMAKGVLPTPLGPVLVSWRREDESLMGVFRGPSGCKVRLQTEDADCSKIDIRQDGHRIKALKATGNGLTWTLNGGEYVIDIITEQSVAQRRGQPRA